MSISFGQTVQVKAGQKDEDTGVSLAGWSGRVLSSESGMLEVEWDSPTLRQLPDAYIRHSIDEGYDYLRYHIEAAKVDAIEPKDTAFQVEEVQKALEAHYSDYELSGRRPLPFSAAEREAGPGEASEEVSQAKKELLALLKSIEGSGSFATSGTRPFIHPGLHIQGIGEIGLPLAEGQARDIIEQARRAPFGKGSRTITDTTVRSAWEIGAALLSFRNKEWEKTMRKIVKGVKKGLGIEEPSVSASLYKLLVYEEGDFFLPHQDSEKEKGMFATLVVGLPSAHTGGELIVRFDGREETVDFSAAASSYEIPYAAFYADCEHEIKPVTSGYRLCLVYNLLQSADAPKISGPQFSGQVGKMAKALQSIEGYLEWRPMAVLLGHQYTPANFSLPQLKLHDRPRAEALMEAAEEAGYFASLGLVTLYRMGELEEADYYYSRSSRRRSRYYDEEEESSGGAMGEIYEEYVKVEHWGEGDTPGLGEAPVREEDILTELELGEGDPIEKEEEGYTGNAGMTMEYWYHYGALLLWPKSRHLSLLASRPIPVRLQWLEYYLRHWGEAGLAPQESARRLLASLAGHADPEEKSISPNDFSVVAAAFTRLGDEGFLKQQGETLLAAVFDKIKVEGWLALLQQYKPESFHPIFQKAADTDDAFVLRHLTDILMALGEPSSVALAPFALHHIRRLPDYLGKARLHKLKESTYYYGSERPSHKETISALVENVLALSIHAEADADWVKAMLERIAGRLPRKYANEVLAPILLSRKYNDRALAKALYETCLRDFQSRTAVKPSPPPDWSRDVPESTYYQKIWDILAPFLRSPTQQVFDYQANQSYRTDMERAVKNITIDLKTETIRKGSPHTLRLTKTQAAYERELKKWKEDVALLGRLEKGGMG